MAVDIVALPVPAEFEVVSNMLKLVLDHLLSTAESLAVDFENGEFTDRGGADALRLFCAIARGQDDHVAAQLGHLLAAAPALVA